MASEHWLWKYLRNRFTVNKRRTGPGSEDVFVRDKITGRKFLYHISWN